MVKELRITRRSGDVLTVLLDDEDFDVVTSSPWHIHQGRSRSGGKGAPYVARNTLGVDGRRGIQLLHRWLLGVTDPKIQVDHVNRNGLDNRRGNLRLCTQNENQHNQGLRRNNTSGLKGVSWSKVMNKWEAYVWLNRKKVQLGYFADPTDAAESVRVGRERLHREFANHG